MTENKRYVDNGFEAIEDQSFTDTETDKTYYVDYFDEIVDLVNNQEKRIKELEQFKLSIISFAECNENINSRTLNDLIELIDYD